MVAVFNLALAWQLAPALAALSLVGFVLVALQYRRAGPPSDASSAMAPPTNPLELSAAAVFALLFVATSTGSAWAAGHFGAAGINVLAGIIGVTDIDPFVLSLAQGAAQLPPTSVVIAILIATASNNLLKAGYTIAIVRRRGALPAVATLALLSATAIAIAIGISQT